MSDQLAAIDNGRELSPLDAQSPTIEQILMHAIDRGIDPANLERLVALQRSIAAERAEKSYTAALLDFREIVPKIVKRNPVVNKSGVLLYKYADLENVQEVIDPLLHERGFCYSFDSELVGNEQMCVTCIMRHRDGHVERHRFIAPRMKIINASETQNAGGTMSFGERMALLAAMGLRAAKDNDARPSPAPEPDRSAPVVGTREERKSVGDRVTAEQLNVLLGKWSARGSPGGNFRKWVADTLQTSTDFSSVGNWTVRDAVEIDKVLIDMDSGNP